MDRYEEALERAKAGKPMDEVFPELKESEDERIRKEIRNFLIDMECKEEWISYLEKQKEQKPVEWSEEDNIGWDEAFACVTRAEKAAKSEEELQNAVTAERWLKEIKFMYCVHPVKQEWSEEDNVQLNAAIQIVSNSGHYTTANWLKSLRPQSKQDIQPSLGEKEIICLKRILDYVRDKHNQYDGADFTNEIAVLEWLITHPVLVYSSQPSWKPSEEQMEALENAWLECDSKETSVVLSSLMSDLQKLL